MDVQFNLSEIKAIAATFLDKIGSKKIIALHGQMGVGKTTFVQAICTVLGVKDAISSPTFSIINEYALPSGECIYHIDLYRLKSLQDAIAAGVEDAIYCNNLCIVEWPEIAPTLFDTDTVHVFFTIVGDNERMIKINSKN